MNLALAVFVVLIVAGVLVWLVMRAPFIDATWKEIIKYAAIVLTVLWLLRLFLHYAKVPLW